MKTHSVTLAQKLEAMSHQKHSLVLQHHLQRLHMSVEAWKCSVYIPGCTCWRYAGQLWHRLQREGRQVSRCLHLHTRPLPGLPWDEYGSSVKYVTDKLICDAVSPSASVHRTRWPHALQSQSCLRCWEAEQRDDTSVNTFQKHWVVQWTWVFTFRSDVSAHASMTWWYHASSIGEPSRMFSLNVALKIHACQYEGKR